MWSKGIEFHMEAKVVLPGEESQSKLYWTRQNVYVYHLSKSY
jgi:hypothetical protein